MCVCVCVCVFNLSLCIYTEMVYLYSVYIYIMYTVCIYIYTPETIVKIVQTLPKPEAPAPAPVVWTGTTITAARCATRLDNAPCGDVRLGPPKKNKWDAGSRCLRWPVSKHAPQENHRQTIGKTSWENDGKWWYNYNQQTFEMQLKAHSSSDFYGIVYVYS